MAQDWSKSHGMTFVYLRTIVSIANKTKALRIGRKIRWKLKKEIDSAKIDFCEIDKCIRSTYSLFLFIIMVLPLSKWTSRLSILFRNIAPFVVPPPVLAPAPALMIFCRGWREMTFEILHALYALATSLLKELMCNTSHA